MLPTTIARPLATATIEPMGSRSSVPREHLVKITLKLSTIDAQHADKGYVAHVARKSLEGFPPPSGQLDQRHFGDLSVTSKGKAGKVTTVVVGVEGSVVWRGRPGDDSVRQLRAALLGEGYRVALRGKRECAEPGCLNEAVVEWEQPSAVPLGWYSNQICGRHNYRTCPTCKSVYLLTSENSSRQAPSVPCEVCGVVMIEWGGSKLWNAELLTRGNAAA